MTPAYMKGALALLVVTIVTSYVSAEGDNGNNEYLRFGRENGGYIRFGRNDPFLRFGKKNDPFLRFGKQDPFLRFGRQDPFLRFGRNDPYLRFGRNDPYLRFGRNDPYLRFGKNDPFLRFGKSGESEAETDLDAVTLSREHSFADENDTTDRKKRSVLTDDEMHRDSENVLNREAREATDVESHNKMMDNKLGDENSGVRETRNAQYMRFGKKSISDGEDFNAYDLNFLENEFSRFIRNYGNTRVTLPRFGKRKDREVKRKNEYMRFGRSGL